MEGQSHILVVDDDTRLRQLLNKYLVENGYLVSTAADAAQARQQLGAMTFDLIVLDVMMPGENGLALTKSLRSDNAVPILLLTAMGETTDRINGLEVGADDYLTKPFEPRELLLRINSILRRSVRETPAEPRLCRFGRFTFESARGELLCDGEAIHLTSAEAALLAQLALTPGETLSREDLAARTGNSGNLRTVDVQVTRLRKKIEEDPRLPRYLQTVRGRGYVLWTD
ncbi:response regulator [Telmatospirillum siberiense]|uniref:DNA-binding response regulator n=1 Tax=Telmatospirillum siberiense TaxID=382514 RepID=A0A2N3PU64_9PROT|nr:response regulator [Telmatospirillum siberiense]PKU23943.1 DNA-binding response regulator [Telmatospirillum siberiense]